MLDYDMKKDLIEGSLVIDLKEICLTQLHADTPIVFQGPGTISQNKDGDITLKLLMNHGTNFRKLLDHRRSGNTAGIVVPPSSYYQMVAKEYSKTVWECDALRISSPRYLDGDDISGSVTANLASIQSRSGPSKAMSRDFRGIIPGKLEIPYDRDASGGLKKYPRTRMKFRVQKVIEVELEDSGASVSISAKSDSADLTPDVVKSILEAISVAIGHPVTCIYSHFIGPDGHIQSINRHDFQLARHSLPQLFPDENATSFKEFVDRYLMLQHDDRTKYFSYWENLHDAWPAGLAVSALPLSVYIEGIVNELFKDYIRPDSEMLEAVRAAQVAIDELAIKKTSRERLKGALNSIGNGTASEALGHLAGEGWFDKASVKIWKKVRNKSAHAVDFNRLREHDEIQEIFTGVFTCLHIFYRLLILLVGFRGAVRDFSKPDFPTSYVDARPKRNHAKSGRSATRETA